MIQELTLVERHVMEHACGWTSSKAPLGRNYYSAEPGHHSWSILQDLCDRGLMKQHAPHYFHVTLDGLFALLGFDAEYVVRHRLDLLRALVLDARKRRRGVKPLGVAP